MIFWITSNIRKKALIKKLLAEYPECKYFNEDELTPDKIKDKDLVVAEIVKQLDDQGQNIIVSNLKKI